LSLTTNVPVFPGFIPDQVGGAAVTYPVRSPTWNIKKTPKWNNVRHQAVNGRMLVVKYWANPLWDFELAYGYIKDNPADQAAFYPTPIPYTDYQILSGFYNGMQGGGNEFAFTPPDSVVGGTFTTSAVSGTSNYWTIYVNNTLSAGLYAILSGFTTTTWLNGQILPIIRATPTYIVVYYVHANQALVNEAAGHVIAGQSLATPDSNNNIPLINTTGGYPTLPLGGTPTVTNPVTEATQLIDAASLSVYANGTLVGSGYTIQPADSIAPYGGLVLNFTSAPSSPVMALFNYYYLCRFSEDSQEFENFMTGLWMCSSLKFEQVRI